MKPIYSPSKNRLTSPTEVSIDRQIINEFDWELFYKMREELWRPLVVVFYWNLLPSIHQELSSSGMNETRRQNASYVVKDTQ